ncbi:extracellular catalytic domain type 1 short-chain-length polyhydroxyalkanoate depolymerase [Catellatospora sichuanensis]|uniref:extracellular catalytic domain type 1 short-chain-length polyhydroxyalkanoate depolymerase n=1 Tax=Catellatospora sichuanensis TaxID=1969805 RepID=UPI001183B301|nr:PHB depolymerase family esterase [Catellatospora sichuanensis]
MSELRHAIAVVALLAATVAGCDTGSTGPAVSTVSPVASPEAGETPAPGDHRLTTSWNGKNRSFVVHAPPSYDGATPLPLVVTMHFFPGDAAGIATTTGMNAKADREGFLVLYPEGFAGGVNALSCCGSEDDVGLIKTLVARMVERWHADPKAIFATGISNGGDMAYRLAVEMPGVFAAIAPVSGGFSGGRASRADFRPTQPVSVITFVGGKDRHAAAFESGLTAWQERLSCTPAPAAGPRLPNGGTRSVAACADGSELVVYRLPQMGHSWPGAQQGTLADPDAGVNATDLIWEFFRTHRR